MDFQYKFILSKLGFKYFIHINLCHGNHIKQQQLSPLAAEAP